MKRDKELIKAILEYAEEYKGKGGVLIKPEHLPDLFQDVSLDVLIRHGLLLLDKGLIKGSADRFGISISRITWEGYEFLDNAREPKVWNAAMKAAGNRAWGVFTAVLTQSAMENARTFLG